MNYHNMLNSSVHLFEREENAKAVGVERMVGS